MNQDRRTHDEKIQVLLERLEKHKAVIEDHSIDIQHSTNLLDKVIANQENLTKKLTGHIDEETEALEAVSRFLRDLKGFDTILRYIGLAGKWITLIITLGGAVTLLTTYLTGKGGH